MPAIKPGDEIVLAFDMHGCPNRCRHCWLDHQVVTTPRTAMTEDDVRWVVAQFRAYRRPENARTPWSSLRVSTWLREPDYADDYRQLRALETQLSDVAPPRDKYELLSVWRLARDPDYAHWGHELGIRESQLSFFGLEKATDWAVRRRGAFRDLLTATERLLAAGIRPRWQLFFTKLLIPDLPGLIALADGLRLKERCEALGGPFTFWMHSPAPDGAALGLERLRPTDHDLDSVPRDFLAHSEAHMGRSIGIAERALLPVLLENDGPVLKSASDAFSGNPTCIFITATPGFDVYPSFTAISPAFHLGNLKTDGVGAIIDAWEREQTPGLQAMFRTPTCELARRYGRPHGRRLYDTGDLEWRWASLAARERT
jgi:hypothetical protein